MQWLADHVDDIGSTQALPAKLPIAITNVLSIQSGIAEALGVPLSSR